MRILIVTEDMPSTTLGGAGKHAVTLANALLDAGHDVEMLGTLREAGVTTDNGFRGVLHTLIDFSRTGWKQAKLGIYAPMSTHHMARRLWSAICQVGLRFDVIHYHGHNPTLGTMVPASVNFVHTLHDQGAECVIKLRFKNGAPCADTDPRACAGCYADQPNALQTAVTAWSVDRYRALAVTSFTRHKAVFVSGFLEQRFRKINGAPSGLRTTVVHNFTDITQIRRQVAGLPPRPPQARPRVFMAGRLGAEKGFSSLLAALPAAAFERLQITVAGHGYELDDLRSRYGPLGVTFPGWQSMEDVLRQTAHADACVVPSIWEEPCGTTVLEALALGRPVFALARGGTPELARYQRWPGQLALFDGIAPLAAAVAQVQPCDTVDTVDDATDIQRRLPEILAVYRQRPGVPDRLTPAAAAADTEAAEAQP